MTTVDQPIAYKSGIQILIATDLHLSWRIDFGLNLGLNPNETDLRLCKRFECVESALILAFSLWVNVADVLNNKFMS